MTQPVRIYGDRHSGNCLKVKWTADRLAIPYDWHEVNVVKGETRTDDFLAINPAGQVPCLEREDGRILAQSNAIIIHLAAGSALIPADPFDHAKMLEWMFWEQYSHEPFIAVRRFQKAFQHMSEDAIDPQLMAKGRRALGVMEMRLLSRDFIVRDQLTLADIALVAYTRVADEGGFDLDEFLGVRGWIARVESELELDYDEGRVTVPG
ncbi:glutathione S-transferase [Maricaulis sp. W15]|uniref:Glutathione S-transferase n=1 Tax=Maricaulis maris TaxID=74318 RepID=A0A495DD51_9PROT|nr:MULTISPECIES: glutathione S-transferase family protein [Maricaulis]OLF74014.1 glutathione S-transferase [Maricaulis sp. W15]RKR00193.1 glutathione S-transferase [Maricaulis maris]